MNDTVIEAMSQFEIPRPILRSSVWPARRVGHGPARHRVRAVQFLWIRHATPLQLFSLFRGEGVSGARSAASRRNSVMSTLPPAKPVIAVDLTAKPKQIREEGYVPQSVNGKEVHLGAASEAKPVEPSKARFHLTRFRDIAITEGVAYLVKDLLPTRVW